MASKFIEYRVTPTGTSRVLRFAGDKVQLSGQVDYPHDKPPAQGYPLIFIIQHATCVSRRGYQHISTIGSRCGAAVFRWDKRGTGDSAGGGAGSLALDTLSAYETALYEPNIDTNKVVIFAQNEGTVLLGDNYSEFVASQRPKGIVLAGNMLDDEKIMTLDVPLTVVMSKNDWNDWHIYAEKTVAAYNQARQMSCPYYIAPNTNRCLMYSSGNSFDTGAAKHIETWLRDLWQTSTSV